MTNAKVLSFGEDLGEVLGTGVFGARVLLGLYPYDLSLPQDLLPPGYMNKTDNTTSDIKIYPNLASNKLYMEFKDDITGGFIVDIYNYIGNIVLSEKISTFKTIYTLNTSTLKNGIYIYNISTSDKTYKGKFTIIK